jgi:DNA-binding SARP family transcriptional activator
MASVDLAESERPLPAVRTGPRPCRLDVRIIGPLRIRRGDAILGCRELGGPKPRQVLELLLLSLGIPVSKDRLIEILWAGQAPPEALPTLESYVSVLRRHLQPGMRKDGPLRTVTGGYMVDRSLVDLDLDRFDALLRRAETAGPQHALVLLKDALGLASAPLLGDELLPSWAEDERARHAARVFHARVMASEAALAVGKAQMAATWAREAIADDPLSERAWTAMILGLEKSGQLTEALRAFEHCRRIMDREMGCAPGAALRSAHARLLKATADDSLPADPPFLHTSKIRILTINGHRTFTELLTGALDREPDLLSVGAAASAEAGVEMSRELVPDVVILDYHLPDDDGFGAARRILAAAPRTRIVMLAGNPTPESHRQAAAIGICAFLPKDGSLATMLDALRRIPVDG